MRTKARVQLAKQFGTYADTTTAFALLQAIALGYALLGTVNHGKDLKSWPAWLIALATGIIISANAIYLMILSACHTAENDLMSTPKNGDLVGKWISRLRRVRIAIVCFAVILSVFAFLMTSCYGRHT